ncbi:hypothetical protein H6P81_017825 [Aristolochia fimbriata]|uniref:Reverse transcriptase domain-containing protein n=1 Tax=Aristolochia fimbriata TaxID=158543 RepID=A0AAV7E259_ARIFI|nr:hypothetical protein H6P81_017825 [Aristolochia fimbriata]
MEVSRGLIGDLVPFQNPAWVTAEAEGTAGGILMVWDSNLLELEEERAQHCIGVKFKDRENATTWSLGGVYGPCTYRERQTFWEELGDLLSRWSVPWLLAGDFNAIRFRAENSPPPSRINATMKNFNDFIGAWELEEIPTSGKRFTWSNGRSSPTLFRLDRFLALESWIHLFRDATGAVGGKVVSDHWPILLDTKTYSWGRKSFKFENWWLQNEQLIPLMKEWWASFEVHGPAGGRLAMKLKKLKQKLIVWAKHEKATAAAQRTLLQLQVDALDAREEGTPLSLEEFSERNMASHCLRNLISHERIIWKQRARYRWLKEEDANTRFFHAIASARRQSNRVSSLMINGEYTSERSSITNALVEYFADLYRKEERAETSLHGIPIHCITTVQEASLETSFQQDEIERVVKKMPLDKAPGPDGFNGEFYRASWDFIAEDATAMLNEFYNRGTTYRRLGASSIALIPKKESVEQIKDFRPISLISSPYKIISKILSEILKKVLPNVISKEQSAFMKTRQILDAAMVAHEVADSFMKSRESRVIIKLDMEKAFDQVDWNFLDAMMQQMGFGNRWRTWMRSCVSSAAYSISVNGGTFGYFRGSRELRQGDPLSPLLFNIVGEGLTALVRIARRLDWIQPVISEDFLPLAQFADDTILFGVGTEDEILRWKALIGLFELASGQKVNWLKSAIYGFNLTRDSLEGMANLLGCRIGSLPDTYLGLPLFHGRITKPLWDPVIEKIQNRHSMWKRRMISKAGRLILINSCLLGIHTDYLSFLHCPCNVADRLEKIFRDFLLKDGQEGFKYHLVRWEEINQNTDTPWCAMVRAKLGIDGDPWVLGWDSPRRLSVNWRYISRLFPDFRPPVRYRVGNGLKTSFWSDPWLLESPLRVAFPRLYRLARMQEATVDDIVRTSPINMIDWAEVFRREMTEAEAAEFGSFNTSLLKFYQCTNVEDELVWSLSPNGSYTVASAYTHLLGNPSGSSQAKLAWKMEAPPKVKMFIWSVAHNRILTRENLVRRGIPLPSLLCPLCEDKQESVDHLLLQCTMAWHIWSWFIDLFGTHWCIPSRVMDLLREEPPPWLALRSKLMWSSCVAFILWALWTERNRRVFQGKCSDWRRVIIDTKERIIGWLKTKTIFKEFSGDQMRSNWCAIAAMKQGDPTDAPVGWRPPPSGCIKLNFDGSSQGNPGPAGFGGVFRDHEGNILLTYAGPLGHEDSTSS